MIPAMRAHPTMSSGDWLALVILSIVWGGSFFFFKILVVELPVPTIVTLRVVGAALILLVIVRVRGLALPRSPNVWASFAVMGIFNNIIPFSLIIWAETHIQSGLAASLNATTPLFSVVLAHFTAKAEPMTTNRVIGVLFGIVGVGVLVGPSALAGLNPTNLSQLACVAIYARRFKRLNVSPLVVATGQTTMSAVLVTPVALWLGTGQPFYMPSPGACWALAGLIVLSTVFAYVLYFRILSSAGATNALLVTFLTPISALALGGLFLGERLTLRDVVGAVVIFAGLAVMDGRLLRALRPRTGAV
jgi:drug/metabolite transporter (DMT)-like permease